MPLQHIDSTIRIFNRLSHKSKRMIAPPLFPLLLKPVYHQLVNLLLLHQINMSYLIQFQNLRADQIILYTHLNNTLMHLSLLLLLVERNYLTQGSHHFTFTLVLIYSLACASSIYHPNIRQILQNCLVLCYFALQMDIRIQLPQNCDCPFTTFISNLLQFKLPQIVEKSIGDVSIFVDDQMDIKCLRKKFNCLLYFLFALGGKVDLIGSVLKQMNGDTLAFKTIAFLLVKTFQYLAL